MHFHTFGNIIQTKKNNEIPDYLKSNCRSAETKRKLSELKKDLEDIVVMKPTEEKQRKFNFMINKINPSRFKGNVVVVVVDL